MNVFKKAREQKGMKQEELAREVGVERSTVTKWETGTSFPRATLLPKLAEVLGCTIDELLRTEPKKENPA